MTKFLDNLFYIIYSLYTKWKDFDAFYHSAFVVGVLFASSFTFLLKLFFITKNKIFDFELLYMYAMWFSIIAIFIYYYYRRKNKLIDFYSKNKGQLNRNYILYYIVLVLMFSTWFLTPII